MWKKADIEVFGLAASLCMKFRSKDILSTVMESRRGDDHGRWEEGIPGMTGRF